MSNAEAAYDMVIRASRPWFAWDNTKSKQARAAMRLEAHGLRYAPSRVERAWKRLAGRRIRQAIEEAFERWEVSLALQRPTIDREVAIELHRLKEAIDASSDPDFYEPHFEALRAAVYGASDTAD